MQTLANRPAKHLVLVEDNVNDEEMEVRGLKRAWPSLNVTIARDGDEAQRMLLDSGVTPPDLVLLDIKLPKVSGIELLEALRADPRYKCVPIVMLTSSAEFADVMSCYGLGANSFIQKALDYDEFMRNLAVCAEYWLSVNINPQG